jgi:hypothetical protein
MKILLKKGASFIGMRMQIQGQASTAKIGHTAARPITRCELQTVSSAGPQYPLFFVRLCELTDALPRECGWLP